MERSEYVRLRNRGAVLLRSVLQELNEISYEHCRYEKDKFRRSSDWHELCIAAALLERKMQSEQSTGAIEGRVA